MIPGNRQLILKKLGRRRKRSDGTQLAIGQNVVDFFDNFWPGNQDKISPVRVPLSRSLSSYLCLMLKLLSIKPKFSRPLPSSVVL